MSKTHGDTGTREYETWKNLKTRCYNVNHQLYKDYGARGIKVVPAWHKYENFRNDMGDKPKGYTIERIDNDGDYGPDNCKWATTEEQSINKRNNVRIKHNGIIKTINEWARLSVVKPQTFRSRIIMNWSIHAALYTPAGQKRKSIQ